jgi:HEPN domain-containing protein
MKKTTAEWVRKAEADHIASTKIGPNDPPLHEVVCFHCQQSAEKYLKALLAELGLTVPQTHNWTMYSTCSCRITLPYAPSDAD